MKYFINFDIFIFIMKNQNLFINNIEINSVHIKIKINEHVILLAMHKDHCTITIIFIDFKFLVYVSNVYLMFLFRSVCIYVCLFIY